jgi:Protein of unknown function (DUF3738)
MIIPMHQNSKHRHHHRLSLASFLAIATLIPAFGQTFEVATVKSSNPNAPGTMLNWRHAAHAHSFVAENFSLRQFITAAYGIRDHQLTGGPGWIGSDRFDLVGKPENPVAPVPRA